MKIKRFEAVDMEEAIRKIKREMGPEAVILSTRRVRRGGGVLGLFGPVGVEVTAAIDYDGPISSPQSSSRSKNTLQSLLEDLQGIKEGMQSLKDLYSTRRPDHGADLQQAIGQLREALETLKQENRKPELSSLHENLVVLYQRLIAAGIDEWVALKSVESVQQQLPMDRIKVKEYTETCLVELLSQLVKVSGPLLGQDRQQKVAIFIGPTGVGKTTTIAKLAAHHALADKARVALITLDTYRIAAVEQLKTYARIIGVPVNVASNAWEVREILAHRKEADLVMIDTAGRSQRDQFRMTELQDLFKQGLTLETCLVLSATTKENDLKDILQKYRGLTIDRLIFTKLDETTTCGNVFNTLLGTGKPLSYITFGQKVPEDIELATPKRLVDLVLKG